VEHKYETHLFRRSFTNYFGIGLDGRIVYTVEKCRGSNIFLNKLKYTFQGIKNFFKSLDSINYTINVFKEMETSQSLEEPFSEPTGEV
jgi:hypothetical protein